MKKKRFSKIWTHLPNSEISYKKLNFGHKMGNNRINIKNINQKKDVKSKKKVQNSI